MGRRHSAGLSGSGTTKQVSLRNRRVGRYLRLATRVPDQCHNSRGAGADIQETLAVHLRGSSSDAVRTAAKIPPSAREG